MRNPPTMAFAAFVAAAVSVGLVLILVRGEAAPAPPGAIPSPAISTPAQTTEQARTGPRAVIVKIDNVAAARPHTGLGSADIVYVEPVEGGLTRLAAAYIGQVPEVVGPVRSARESDAELLAQFGTPTLAYSGTAPELLPILRNASLVLASPEQAGAAYFRSGGRGKPHNMYVHPAQLPAPGQRARRPVLEFGPAPEGGSPVADHQVRYRAASFGFHWSGPAGRWLISTDGAPMRSTESGRLSATTVIVQHVATTGGVRIADASGSVSPVINTVGTGKAEILRDGKRFDGTWTRTKPDAPTRFRTVSAQPLPLAKGPVWILLVPDG